MDWREVIRGLRMKTVANNCTEQEEQAAKKKIAELEAKYGKVNEQESYTRPHFTWRYTSSQDGRSRHSSFQEHMRQQAERTRKEAEKEFEEKFRGDDIRRAQERAEELRREQEFAKARERREKEAKERRDREKRAAEELLERERKKKEKAQERKQKARAETEHRFKGGDATAHSGPAQINIYFENGDSLSFYGIVDRCRYEVDGSNLKLKLEVVITTQHVDT